MGSMTLPQQLPRVSSTVLWWRSYRKPAQTLGERTQTLTSMKILSKNLKQYVKTATFPFSLRAVFPFGKRFQSYIKKIKGKKKKKPLIKSNPAILQVKKVVLAEGKSYTIHFFSSHLLNWVACISLKFNLNMLSTLRKRTFLVNDENNSFYVPFVGSSTKAIKSHHI